MEVFGLSAEFLEFMLEGWHQGLQSVGSRAAGQLLSPLCGGHVPEEQRKILILEEAELPQLPTHVQIT